MTTEFILYHILTLDPSKSREAFNALPQSIRTGIAQAYRQQRANSGPQLTPWEDDCLTRNRKEKEKLNEQLMVAAAVMIGVVLLCVLAPPVGAAAAGVATRALAGATATDAVVAGAAEEAVFAGYRVAPLVRVAGSVSVMEAAEETVDFVQKLYR